MYRFKKFTQTQSSSNLNELDTLVGEKHSPVSSSFSWRVLRSSAEERTNTYSIGCISKAIPHLLLQLLLKSYEKIYNSSRCTSSLTIRPLFFFPPNPDSHIWLELWTILWNWTPLHCQHSNKWKLKWKTKEVALLHTKAILLASWFNITSYWGEVGEEKERKEKKDVQLKKVGTCSV